MTDIVERLRRMARIQFAQYDHDAINEAADEIEGLRDEIRNAYRERDEASQDWEQAVRRIAELEQENARLIEDRARFPDRPDDIGRMIDAHIGNLKAARDSADKYADKYRTERDIAQRRVSELEQQLASRAVPEGWRPVPVEPTPEMLYAAREADTEYQRRMGLPDTIGVGAYDHYISMLAATPSGQGR